MTIAQRLHRAERALELHNERWTRQVGTWRICPPPPTPEHTEFWRLKAEVDRLRRTLRQAGGGR